MSKIYSSEEIEALRASYDALDRDDNNGLDEEELTLFFKNNNFDPTYVKMAFAIFDTDHTGLLTFDQFKKFYRGMQYLSTEPRRFYKMVFNAMDTDKSGAISASELVSFMNLIGKPISLEQAKKEIKKVDHTGTGTLLFSDVCRMLG